MPTPFNVNTVDDEYVPYSASTPVEPIEQTPYQRYEDAMYLAAVSGEDVDTIHAKLLRGEEPKERSDYERQKQELSTFDKINDLQYFIETGQRRITPQSTLPQDAVMTDMAQLYHLQREDGTTQQITGAGLEYLESTYGAINAESDVLKKAQMDYEAQGGFETVFDFAGMLVPGNDWFTFTNAAYDFTGEWFINPYNAFVAMRDKYQQIALTGTPDEIRKAGNDLYNIIKDHSGILGVNQLQASAIYEQIVNDPNSDYGSASEIEIGAIMLGDIATLPWKTITRGAKLLNKTVNPYSKSEILTKANQIDPAIADAMVVEVLETDAKMAAAKFGMSEADFLDRVNRPPIGSTMFPSQGGFLHNTARIAASFTGRLINRTKTRPELFTETERAFGEVIELGNIPKTAPPFTIGVLKTLRDINVPNGARLHLNSATKAVQGDDGLYVQALYGYTPEKGFLTFDDAAKNASAYFDSGKTISIYKKDPSRTKLEKIWTGTTADLSETPILKNLKTGFEYPKNEYFVERIDQVPYTADYNTGIMFGDNALRLGLFRGLKWMNSASAVFSKEYMSQIFASNQARDLIAQQLGKIAKPYIKLNNTPSMATVNKFLEETEGMYWHEIPAAKKGALTNKELEAVLAKRQVEDAIAHLKNHKIYLKNKADGYDTITYGGETFTAKILNDTKDVHQVYDPTNRKIINFDSVDLEDGKKFVIESKQMRYDGVTTPTAKDDLVRGTNHILVDSDSVKVKELDYAQLAYIPGHNTRIYKDPFFVFAEFRVAKGGGVVDTKPMYLATAPDGPAAQNIVDAMKAEYPDINFDYRPGRHMGFEKANTAYDEIDANAGRLLSARGMHLMDGADNLANTKDPLNALVEEMNYVAKRIGIDDAINSWIERWKNTYANPNDMDNWSIQGKVPEYPDSELKITNEKAKYAWRYIENELKKTIDEGSQRRREYWYEKYNTYMGREQTAINRMKGKAALWAAENNLSGVVRGINFAQMVATNAIRQLMLNARQWTLVVPTNPEYFLGSGRAARDVNAFTVLAIKRFMSDGILKDADYKSLSKVAGRDWKELKSMHSAWLESGLMAEIDHLDFAGIIARDASTSRHNNYAGVAKKMALGTYRVPAKVLKKTGFDFGEYVNRMVTWLSEHDLAIKNGMRKGSRTTYRQVDANTEAKVHSLNRVDSLSYQRSYLKFITQFWPIQHKAFQLLTSSRMLEEPGKAFWQKQKFRMATGQVAFYGATGIGLKTVAEKLIEEAGLDPSDKAVKLVEYGLGEPLTNAMLSYLSGEDVNLATAESFAVATIPDTVIELFFEGIETEKSAWELYLGATGSSVDKLVNVVNVGVAMNKAQDLTNPETIKEMAFIFGEMFTGLNATTSARAMRILGTAVNKYGTPYDNAIVSNIITRAARYAGIRTRQEHALWDLNAEATRSITNDNPAIEDARYIFQLDFKDWLDLADTAGIQSVEAQDLIHEKITRRVAAMDVFYGDDLVRRNDFRKAYTDQWRKALAKDNTVVTKLYNLITGGGDIDTIEKVRKRMLGLGLINEEQSQSLATLMRNWRGEDAE